MAAIRMGEWNGKLAYEKKKNLGFSSYLEKQEITRKIPVLKCIKGVVLRVLLTFSTVTRD